MFRGRYLGTVGMILLTVRGTRIGRTHTRWPRWTIERHLEEHARQTRLLREPTEPIDVVVTHWPSTLHAVAPRFAGSPLNGYFVNNREDLVEDIASQYWISGPSYGPRASGCRQPPPRAARTS